ncbi:MAG: ABC transporter permease [Clostridia bacterium]|nr:ABC transporter permease [Clostridia bacterium]
MKKRAEHQEPFVRMTKRASITPGKAWVIRGIALLGAIVTGALLLLILGHNPFGIYGEMVRGAFGGTMYIKETVRTAVPLLISAIGIAFAFKMKFWNIGAEGQILIGGIAASAVAIHYDAQFAAWAAESGSFLPRILMLVLMFLAAIVAGGLYGVVPAVFKSKWGTNETLFTLMLNYIALQYVKYLAYQPAWKMAGTSFPKVRMFDPIAVLPKVMGIHIGWIIALVLVVVAHFYLTRTKHGYEIAVVGESTNTARYAGINVSKVYLRTMFISGALCGLAGYLVVSGADGTLTEGTAGGVGFTAITVAWLSKMNPITMLIVAVFIAALDRGAGFQSSTGVPESCAEVLVGIILFFMLGCEFFINYKLVFRGRKEAAA